MRGAFRHPHMRAHELAQIRGRDFQLNCIQLRVAQRKGIASFLRAVEPLVTARKRDHHPARAPGVTVAQVDDGVVKVGMNMGRQTLGRFELWGRHACRAAPASARPAR